jgi:hypothetical protein
VIDRLPAIHQSLLQGVRRGKPAEVSRKVFLKESPEMVCGREGPVGSPEREESVGIHQVHAGVQTGGDLPDLPLMPDRGIIICHHRTGPGTQRQ